MNSNYIFIGENLSALNSVDMKPFIGKIKCIYIDPPYNTKTKKTYNDNVNSTKWGYDIKSRLIQASYYLSTDGCIFISIDDNEYSTLKNICDVVFGNCNYVGTMITRQSQRSNAKWINTVHEYILCYAKCKERLHPFVVKRIAITEDRRLIESVEKEIREVLEKEGLESANKKIRKIIIKYSETYNISWLNNYTNVDEKGNVFFATDLSTPGQPREVNIPEIGLHLEPLKTRGWSSDEKFISLYKKKRLFFKSNGRPYAIHYLRESEENAPSVVNFFSRQGTEDLKRLGLQGLFDTPKPVELIKYLLRLTNFNSGYIMDFYAGSGTTAQAIYEINEEDGKNLNYVLIQKNENINKKTTSYDFCIKNDIKPTVDAVLLHRIDTYLRIKSKDKDYLITKLYNYEEPEIRVVSEG